MAGAIDDLKAAVAAEQTVITQLATDISNAVTALQGAATPADVEAQVAVIQAATTQLSVSAKNLETALNPPALAPAPAA